MVGRDALQVDHRVVSRQHRQLLAQNHDPLGDHAQPRRERVDGRLRHPADGGDDPVLLPLQLAQLAAQLALLRGAGGPQPLPLGDVGVGIGCDRLRVAQMLPQALDDAALRIGGRDRPAVAAEALLLVERAAVAIRADDGQAMPAGAADEEAGERPGGTLDGAALHHLPLPLPDGLPEFVVHDAEVLRARHHPLILGQREGLPPAGVRVLPPGRAVPDDVADVEAVIDDADPEGPIPEDRVPLPRPAARTGDALDVQRLGDGARADPGSILPHDPADDLRLLRDDLEAAALGRGTIAIGAPGGDPAVRDDPAQAAPGLFRQLLEVELRHGAGEADVERADLALREGDDPRAAECDALGDAGDMLKVAADPIERLGDQHVRAASLDLDQRRLEARTGDGGAADGGVGEGASLAKAEARKSFPKGAVLVGDARRGLQVRRVASV